MVSALSDLFKASLQIHIKSQALDTKINHIKMHVGIVKLTIKYIIVSLGAAGVGRFALAAVVIANVQGSPSHRMFPMFDDNECPHCGLPFGPTEWFADLSGIGDDVPNQVVIQDDDELCCCAAEDDDDD